MAYRFHFVGKSAAIKRSLVSASGRLTGTDKTAFDAAKPSIEALVDLNTGAVRLEVHGQTGECTVTLSPLDMELSE